MSIADRILSNQDRDGMLRRSLERIIQLYTDKSHFVYELLQNAEDSCATRIKFQQFEDLLVVMHNGTAFTETNLQGLCDIGQSDKINNLNQIGEFGVGFKSVFGICKTVRLYSNPSPEDVGRGCERFSVEIHDFTRPEEIPYKEVPEGYTTVFEFPYCVGETFSGFTMMHELKRAIATRLKDLGITTLLFMRNLAIIDFEVNCQGLENKGQYRLKKRVLNNWCSRVYAYENEEMRRGDTVSFLRFSMPIQSDMPNRTLDIAFQMVEDEDGKTTFQPAKNPFISVYFPTETESKLKFIVQGPFRTTPNRSSVPADDPENIKFARMLASLLHKSILAVKKLGVLDLSFMQVLPLSEKAFANYSLFLPLFEETRATFRNDEVLPTKEPGKYVAVNRALIAGNIGLIDLFSGHDMAVLQKRKADFEWMPVLLTERGAYSDVYTYAVNELHVDVIRAAEMRYYYNDNPTFLDDKDNDWLVKLYKLYETIPSAFSFSGTSMLDAWIVRTESNKILPAYRKIEGKFHPMVFLPPPNGKNRHGVEIVNTYLYDRCRTFFEKILHLQPPDNYELTKEKIASHHKLLSSIDSKEHLIDIGQAVRYLRNPEREDDMRAFLKKNFYIRVRARGKSLWTRPFEEELYFPEAEDGTSIEQFFLGLPGEKGNVYLDYDFYHEAGYSYEDLRLFDVTDSLLTGMDETSGEYKFEKTGLISEWRTSGAFRWELSIEQVEDALLYIMNHPSDSGSYLKSQIIFKLLLENELRLQGNVSMMDTSDLRDETALIIRILRKESQRTWLKNWNGKWLFDRHMQLVSQKEIGKKDLNESLYGKTRLDSRVYELLGFKKNRLDQIAEATVEYDKIPKETKELYLEIELSRQFGMTVDQLRQLKDSGFRSDSGTGKQEDTDDEFPVDHVKNWEALKKHAAQVLAYASPVSYQSVIRSVRISKSADDVRAYLMNMYRVTGSRKYACQICHRAFSAIEACQLENKPDLELDPLNLCTCPNCAGKFRVIRNNDVAIKNLMEQIMNQSEVSIKMNDHVSIRVDDLDIWFTQTHMAEIKELLTLKKTTDRQIKVKAESEKERQSTYAPKLKLPVKGQEIMQPVSRPIQQPVQQSVQQPASLQQTQPSRLSIQTTSTVKAPSQPIWQPTIKPVQPKPVDPREAAIKRMEREIAEQQKAAKEAREKEERIRRLYMDFVGRKVYHAGLRIYVLVEKCKAKELEVVFAEGPRLGQKAFLQIAYCEERHLIWPKKDVTSLMRKLDIPCVDKRPEGGTLWVIGGHELDPLMEDCSKYGCSFTFKPDGGKATQHKPAWYLVQS